MPSPSHESKTWAIVQFFHERYGNDTTAWNPNLAPNINHRPDFYAKASSPNRVVIGEAKTYGDFSPGDRSQVQVAEFINYLDRMHSEKGYIAILILCMAEGDVDVARQFLGPTIQAGRINVHLINEKWEEYRL